MKLLKRNIFFTTCIACLMATSCIDIPSILSKRNLSADFSLRDNTLDKYRPGFHFTPDNYWINDPNGLVYKDGYYHLFYQHHPYSTVWGPMHWGHAISKDLINWERLPVALYPDENGWIFSGSAVVDIDNTAGFGKNAMIAIYTYHNAEIEKTGSDLFQNQGLAYSLDNGETWVKYSENPILSNPGIRDFRDPKVFWNTSKNEWQMLLAAKDMIHIYSSTNLKDWNKLSEFKDSNSNILGVWECPDLFELNVKGSDEKKWVMLISHGSGAINGGSGTRYIIGDFDGITFTSDQEEIKWLDYGRDNYAGVTYNNLPTNRRILVGWMNNWDYANSIPTVNWRGALTIPREIELIKSNNNYKLTSKPISELKSIVGETVSFDLFKDTSINFDDGLQQYRIQFTVENKSSNFSFTISNDLGEEIKFNYDQILNQGFFDRTKSGLIDFNDKFINKNGQKVENLIADDTLSFDILLDGSSIEMFIEEGSTVLTNQIFPTKPFNKLSFELNEDQVINKLKIETINSVW